MAVTVRLGLVVLSMVNLGFSDERTEEEDGEDEDEDGCG